MDIESLSDFIVLAECKSFSRAAELRHITQPAFSRRIQSLETAIKTPLINRESKAFKLTPAGKRFLTHARNLIMLADNAIRDAQGAMTHLVQPLHLVMPSFLSKTFFPNWYREMQRKMPDIRMQVIHQKGHGAIDDLQKGIADFALILDVEGMEPYYTLEGMKTLRLGTDKLMAVCATHTKEKENLLMYQYGSFMSHCAEKLLAEKIAAEKIVFESSSVGLLKQMAMAGFGTAVLQESVIEEDLVQGYLKPAFDLPVLEGNILLVRPEKPLSKRAELLWEANAPL